MQKTVVKNRRKHGFVFGYSHAKIRKVKLISLAHFSRKGRGHRISRLLSESVQLLGLHERQTSP